MDHSCQNTVAKARETKANGHMCLSVEVFVIVLFTVSLATINTAKMSFRKNHDLLTSLVEGSI